MDREKIRCYSCFGEFDPAGGEACPFCGETRRDNESWQLLAGSMLGGRYLIGLAGSEDESGVVYAGYDPALDLRVAIREYFPKNSATRASAMSAFVMAAPGQAEAFGEGLDAFAREAKAMAHAGPGGDSRLRDFLALGGTEYMITEPRPAEAPAPQSSGDTRRFDPLGEQAVVPPHSYPTGPEPFPAAAKDPMGPAATAASLLRSVRLWRVATLALVIMLSVSLVMNFRPGADGDSVPASSVGSSAGAYKARIKELEGLLVQAQSQREEAAKALEEKQAELDAAGSTLSALRQSYPDRWVVVNGVYNADSELKLISAELESSDMRYLCFDFAVHAEDYAGLTGESFTIRVYRPDGSLWQGEDSPEGATGSFKFGEDDSVYTWGWGNSEQSDYTSGTYTIMFVHDGEMIGGFLAEIS